VVAQEKIPTTRIVGVLLIPHTDSPDSWYERHQYQDDSCIVNRAYYRQFGLCGGSIHLAAIVYLWVD
jgi:hypothetical protein